MRQITVEELEMVHGGVTQVRSTPEQQQPYPAPTTGSSSGRGPSIGGGGGGGGGGSIGIVRPPAEDGE